MALTAKIRQDLLTDIRVKQFFSNESVIEELTRQFENSKRQYVKLDISHLETAWKYLSCEKDELIELQHCLNTEGIDTAISATFVKMLQELEAKNLAFDGLKDVSKESLKTMVSEQVIRIVELSIIAITSHIAILSNETVSSILVFIAVVVLSTIGMNLKPRKKVIKAA